MVSAAYRKSAKRIENLREKDIKTQVLNHFGWECACCRATAGLQLDHIHGNGAEHREVFGAHIYQWLITNNFPAECESGGKYELQVLCPTCNTSKSLMSHCLVHSSNQTLAV
jgi:hypothetical protein